jgi:hypothetical protein
MQLRWGWWKSGDGHVGGVDDREGWVLRLGGTIAVVMAGVRRCHPEGDSIERDLVDETNSSRNS